MQTLIQCFAAVQVDPSPILNPNASIISDKYVFVGNDTATVTNFCESVFPNLAGVGKIEVMVLSPNAHEQST